MGTDDTSGRHSPQRSAGWQHLQGCAQQAVSYGFTCVQVPRYLHVKRPGRKEERVPAGLGTVLRERFEVEELANRHAPKPIEPQTQCEPKIGRKHSRPSVQISNERIWEVGTYPIRVECRWRTSSGGGQRCFEDSQFVNKQRCVRILERTSRAGWSDAIAAKWLSHKKRFMSSVCSIPALGHPYQPSAETGCLQARPNLQGFRFSGKAVALFLGGAVIALYETDAEDKDVRGLERDALRLRSRKHVLERDRVGGERVVWEPTELVGVELDHVEEDAAAADPVLSPVCQGRVVNFIDNYDIT